MRLLPYPILLTACVALHTKSFSQSPNNVQSEWAKVAATGKMEYKSLPKGYRMMDFSSAGYRGGGEALPMVAATVELTPIKGDNSNSIQAAIERVAANKPDEDVFKGAVLLSAGTFPCEKPIRINQSGVVLRGSGRGNGGTILLMKGDAHTCIIAEGNQATELVKETVITDDYLASGTNTVHLAKTQHLKTGDMIRFVRPFTTAWAWFMGMDNLVRDGKNQTWLKGPTHIDITIVSLEGDRATPDLPLTDSNDAEMLGIKSVEVHLVKKSGLLKAVGIEAPEQSVLLKDSAFKGIEFKDAEDRWPRDLSVADTIGAIHLSADRMTVKNVDLSYAKPIIGAAKPADLGANGSQLLFDGCTGTGDELFYFGTFSGNGGPNFLLDCHFRGNGSIQPHMRWAVAWNCKARHFTIQNPPGAGNRAIGCEGGRMEKARPFDKSPMLPEGIFSSHGIPVVPKSL